MGARRTLFISVAKGSILFTIGCWAVVLALASQGRTIFDGPVSTLVAAIGLTLAVIVPDALAARWVLRKLLTDRPRNDARRGATAFAVSAPLALGVGYLLGELVGGYAEVILGRYFVLPAIMTFIIILMIFLPSGVVMWALHPTGGVGSASESEQNEHC